MSLNLLNDFLFITGMFDYSLIRQVLLAQEPEQKSFTSEKERFTAAQALGPDFDALQVIAKYGQLRGCYQIQEPFPDLEDHLFAKWNHACRKYNGSRPDHFIHQLAYHYLGEYPGWREELPSKDYELIFQAFQLLVIPGLMIGRIDAFAAGKVRSNTLEKILVGYEEFRVFTQIR